MCHYSVLVEVFSKCNDSRKMGTAGQATQVDDEICMCCRNVRYILDVNRQ
jgi:hypothetical protein